MMDARHLSVMPGGALPHVWLISDARNDAVLERALARLPRGSGFIFRHHHLAGPARRARFARLMRVARGRGITVVLAGTMAEIELITATVATPQGVTILDGGNLFAAVQGTAGGLPISVQGSADGGLPLNVAGAVTVSGTVTATVAGGTVQGTAAGAPISVQGSADGGLALNVDNSSGPLSDGGVACSNAVAASGHRVRPSSAVPRLRWALA